jgi:excisionase family DNA binding protein
MGTSLKIIEPIVPSDAEAALAEKSSRLLSNYIKSTKKPTVQCIGDTKENQKITLPPLAIKLLMNILEQMGQGNAVTIVPVHSELTTQEAADLLNVSRPYFINLLKEGKIPFHKVGTKRRILAKDVIAYKTAIDKKRQEVLNLLSKQAQELNMGY